MRRANPVPPALLVAIPVVIVVGAVMAFAASEDAKPAKKPAPGGGLGTGPLFGRPGVIPPRAPVDEEEGEEPCQEGWHRSAVTGRCLPPRAPVEEQEEPPARAPINRARAGSKTRSGGAPPGSTTPHAEFIPLDAPSTERQDAEVPAVKGSWKHGYNYELYHQQAGLTPVEALRKFMLMIGYEMEQLTFGNLQPDSSKLIGSEPQQVNKFQRDWNEVVKALDWEKMGASSSHPFFDDMRGLLLEGLSNFSGLESDQLNTNQKATLRAIEIAARAQEAAADTPSLEWQSLVDLARS